MHQEAHIDFRACKARWDCYEGVIHGTEFNF